MAVLRILSLLAAVTFVVAKDTRAINPDYYYNGDDQYITDSVPTYDPNETADWDPTDDWAATRTDDWDSTDDWGQYTTEYSDTTQDYWDQSTDTTQDYWDHPSGPTDDWNQYTTLNEDYQSVCDEALSNTSHPTVRAHHHVAYTFTSQDCYGARNDNYPNNANWNLDFKLPHRSKYAHISLYEVSIEKDWMDDICKYDSLSFASGNTTWTVCGQIPFEEKLIELDAGKHFKIVFNSDSSVTEKGFTFRIQFHPKRPYYNIENMSEGFIMKTTDVPVADNV